MVRLGARGGEAVSRAYLLLFLPSLRFLFRSLFVALFDLFSVSSLLFALPPKEPNAWSRLILCRYVLFGHGRAALYCLN